MTYVVMALYSYGRGVMHVCPYACVCVYMRACALASMCVCYVRLACVGYVRCSVYVQLFLSPT